MKRIAVLALAALMCAFTACTTAPHEAGHDIAPTPAQNTAAPVDDGTAQTAPAETAAPVEAPENTPGSYAEAYAFYKEKLIPALTVRVSRDLASAKQALEERDPGFSEEDASWNDPVMPFYSSGMEFTAGFSDGMDAESVQSVYGEFGYENVEYTIVGPGSYRISYSDELEDGSVNNYEDACEFSGGSVRFIARANGAVTDFCEFIMLGGGRYALQSPTGRALVTLEGGMIRSYSYSETVYEVDWDTNRPTSASVTHDAEADSVWGRTDMTGAWVTECDQTSDLHRVFILDADGQLTYYGCKQIGYGEGSAYEPFAPVSIQTN